MPAHLAKLCFIAPMIGRNPGMVTTPAETLVELFSQAGYKVRGASNKPNRYHRFWDIALTLLRWGRRTDIQCLSVYGGPSFVVEDFASCLGRLQGQRIIMHLHGGALPDFMQRFPRWTKRVLRRADAIVAPSPFLARSVQSYGFNASVIPNLISLGRYPYRRRAQVCPRLFWMRSFHPIWNPLMALRVLQRLRHSRPDATLVMAGQDKGLLVEMQRKAQEMGLCDSLRFAGFLNDEGKAREGNAADVFINTNRVDNMPVAVIEACAMGLPVVSTRVGGIPDLLTDGTTGLLVNDDDDDGMVEAIERLIRQPELADRLSINGRKLAERCSWETVLPQWESLFSRLNGPVTLQSRA